jgi:hypothetical protein
MSIRPGQAKGPYVGNTSGGGGAYLAPVYTLFDPTTAFPVAPALGDRYIASATATHGLVTWSLGNIYEWTGTVWAETIPVDGAIVFAKWLNQLYAFYFGVWRLYSDFWFKPVIAIYDNTLGLPPAPEANQRYIAMVTAFGWFKDSIYEWDTVAWVRTGAADGAMVVVSDLNDTYLYIDGGWIEYPTTWYDPVISIFDNTAATPVGPSTGDRYIALVTANGWTIDYIYEWNYNNWVATIPLTGDMVFNNGDGYPYLYSGAAWVQFAPLTAHDLGGPLHNADTLANLKSKISAPDFLITSQPSEIASLPSKTIPVGTDLMVIEDSEDTMNKKQVTLADAAANYFSPFWVNPVNDFFDNSGGLPV